MIQNNFQKIAVSCGVAAVLSLSTQVSQAGSNHIIGLAYTSGFQDVVDWHDDNLNVETDMLSPVGLTYRYNYNYDSGLRMDIGLGPISMIGGDVDYFNMPLVATVGYNLFQDSGFNVYVRGGLSYHILDGDYVVDDSATGLLGAVGIEAGNRVKFVAEISMDTAEAAFSNGGTYVWNSDTGYTYVESEEEIAIDDVMFTIAVKF
ncbi:MAG: hypothetical protein ABFS39_17340 [Pseudomonadota bacterium]